jgi:hypothetical protein
MSDRVSLVPLSRSLAAGTAGQTARAAGSRWDNSGTIGLKALAAKVLMRDTARDSSGTSPAKSCPPPVQGVGQSLEPVPQIAQPESLSMRDGRRLWRWQAVSIPSAVPDSARALADKARRFGCVLIADGLTLILVERWLSNLQDDTRDAVAANAGTIIALLRGESRVRTGKRRL